MDEMSLAGKSVVLTGGARGIGRAIAAEFAHVGANVLIGDLLLDEAQVVAAELDRGSSGMIIAEQADVANLEAVQALCDTALTQFERIDVLINNAGYDRFIPFLETTPDYWDKIISINYKGVLNTCYTILPHMVAQGGGVIVNLGSDAGRAGSMGESIYAGCKAGVIAFSKTIAREHARDNIRVNVVSPGITKTALYDAIVETEFGQKVMGAIERSVPLGRRAGLPEEIAPAVVFLASDAARYITGQVLSINGGLTMVD